MLFDDVILYIHQGARGRHTEDLCSLDNRHAIIHDHSIGIGGLYHRSLNRFTLASLKGRLIILLLVVKNPSFRWNDPVSLCPREILNIFQGLLELLADGWFGLLGDIVLPIHVVACQWLGVRLDDGWDNRDGAFNCILLLLVNWRGANSLIAEIRRDRSGQPFNLHCCVKPFILMFLEVYLARYRVDNIVRIDQGALVLVLS